MGDMNGLCRSMETERPGKTLDYYVLGVEKKRKIRYRADRTIGMAEGIMMVVQGKSQD
jgi:hypothetical protein